MAIQDALTRIEKAGGSLQPCDDADIASLQRLAVLPLPESYLDFMRRCGRGVRLADTSMREHVVSRLTSSASQTAMRALFRESGQEFAADYFPISFHEQGYAFLFIDVRLGESSPVYRYTEGETASKPVGLPVAEFLETLLAEFLADTTGTPPYRPVPWRE